MARSVTIGLVQLQAKQSEPANRERLKNSLIRSFESGADLVVLPELAYPGYSTDRQWLAQYAQTVQGEVVEEWSGLARRFGGYICGGFCEREGERLFNSAVVLGPEGVLLHYRKLHLFSGEAGCMAPGDLGLPVVELPIGKVGICICYDLRFVEVVRILALRGVELVLVPTAWLPGFDVGNIDEQNLAPQARGVVLQANLNQCFIACASQAGTSPPFEFLGSSLVVDAYGRVLLGPMGRSEEQLATVTIDLDVVRESQERPGGIAPREDRRTDVYTLMAEGERL